MTYLALDPFIESQVDAFEAALGKSPRTDLREFLPPANHEKYLPTLLELVRVDMERAWSRGERRRAEHYEASFPDVRQVPDGPEQIAFEEYRLRCQAGEDPDLAEYRARFGIDPSGWIRWSEYDTEPAGTDPTQISPEHFPLSGDACPDMPKSWYGFQIIELLGSGSFGKTYRARQTALADRDVVLKFSPLNHREAWRLAQLQHTHIVPILSVHECGEHSAICMPYLGRRTLADWLRAKVDPDRSATDGGRETADGVGGQADHVTRVLQIAMHVADALAHSHRRGILHGDVKPANILLTDEGDPLLFDFNLAREATAHSSDRVVGGTLAYMAPEQRRQWHDPSVTWDHRADIYSLGVVVYELLTGRLPPPANDAVPGHDANGAQHSQAPPASLHPTWSPAVNAMLAKCLAPAAEDRYQSAADLHEDLRRHLHDLPLAFAANDSPRELITKWARRHPRLVSGTSVGVLAGAICLALLGAWQVREARHRPIAAAHTFHELTSTWDELRADFVAASQVPGWADGVISQAEGLLARFGLEDSARIDPTVRLLDDEQQRAWKQHASGLAYMLGNAEFLRAQRETNADARHDQLRQSLTYNQLAADHAESPAANGALDHQRTRILQAMAETERGGPSPLDQDADRQPQVPSPPPSRGTRTPRDSVTSTEAGSWYDALFCGLSAREKHDWVSAEHHFRQATALDPQDVSAWLLLAESLRKLQRYESALAVYDLAGSLATDNTGILFQRGMCCLAAGDYPRAVTDFTAVIDRRPDVDSARLNRALASIGLNQYERALIDLDAALGANCQETRGYFVRSRVHEKLGHRREAQADLETGLQRIPRDAISWVARGVARMKIDPRRALADFESALQLDGSAVEALHNEAHVYSEILGEPRKAIAVLSACLRQNSADTIALAGRGVLRARLGETEAALQDAKHLQSLPLDAITCYQVACIYALCSAENASHAAEAIRLLSQSLREDPELVKIVAGDPDMARVRDQRSFQQITDAISVLRKSEIENRFTTPFGVVP